MMKKLAVLGAVAALLAFAAVPAYAGKPAWAGKSDATIVESAIELSGEFDPDLSDGAGGTPFDDDGDDFDILIRALTVTGVIEVFDGSNYTVFAPTDEAFLDLTGELSEADAFDATVAAAEDFGGIENVLAYHVKKGVRVSPSVLNAPSLKMLNGESISADRSGEISANNSTANIINADVRVDDGIIHVIDEVLLP